MNNVVLKEIDLYITEKCNLACPFCSVRAGENPIRELDYDTVTHFVDYCKENKVTDIHVTGGEPTLHKDYKRIIKYIIESGIDVRLITNGLLLTKRDLIELKEIGLRKIMFSLDGTERFHELVRGKGTFKRTLAIVKDSIHMGFNVRVNSVAWEQNTDSILDLLDILNDIGVNVFSVFLGSPVGRAKQLRHLTVIRAADWISFIQSLKDLHNSNKMTIKVVFEQGFIEEKQNAKHLDLRSCASIISNTNYLSVRADGNVFPCVFFSNDFQSIGNIYKRDSYDFYKNLKNSAVYNSIAALPIECNDCEELEYCHGGCRGFNYSLSDVGRDLRCRQDGYIPICPLIKRALFTDALAPCTDDLLE